MRVDQARQDDVTFEVKDFVGGGWQTGSLPYFFDESAPDKDAAIRDLGLAVIHGDDMGVLDKKGCHEV
ncbi:MAG: hypothetical protein AMXMBFR60_04070 [Chloroflexota bacterium]